MTQDWWSLTLSVPSPSDKLLMVEEQRGEMCQATDVPDKQDWWFSDV